jgi:hypothetical protein
VVELHVELSCDCPRGIASGVLNLYVLHVRLCTEMEKMSGCTPAALVLQ